MEEDITVQVLLDEGIINLKNILYCENEIQTRIYIKLGADVNITEKFYKQEKYGYKIRIQDHDLDTPLHNANTAEQTRLLLEAGADVNAKNRNGSTPLHYANTAEQAKLLIDAGVNVKACSFTGYTAYHVAKNEEIKNLILKALKS